MTSWLFGRRSEPPSGEFPQFPPAGGGGGGDGDGKVSDEDKKRMEAYRFDSAALERAAKAARDLEKSSKLPPIFKMECLKHK